MGKAGLLVYCPGPGPADIWGSGGAPDGVVGIHDFLLVLARWGPGPSAADLNDDGIVGILDFLKVLTDWGACPP